LKAISVVGSGLLGSVARSQINHENQTAAPKFLSKAEREKLALERLAETRQSERNQLSATAALLGIAGSGGKSSRTSSLASSTLSSAEMADANTSENYLSPEQERFMREIQEQYLGTKIDVPNAAKAGTGKMKTAGRNKLKFEWDETESTLDLTTSGALYADSYKIALGFGKDRIGGVDRLEQANQTEQYTKALKQLRKDAGFAVADIYSIGGAMTSSGVGLATAYGLEGDAERKIVASSRQKHRIKDLLSLGGKHWSEKRLDEMEERDWRIFREDFGLSYKGLNPPKPARNWNETGLNPLLLRAVMNVGYKEPTPIQRAAIPVALQGRDVIGIAETGSGKTAAFLLPLMAYIMTLPKLNNYLAREGPYAVILAPTRELAQQIQEESKKIGSHVDIRAVSVVGGQSKEEQTFSMREGCEIIIATPGRLADFIRSKVLVLNQCNYVILDEADRMLEFGFESDIHLVLSAMPSAHHPDESEEAKANKPTRRTMMFSATMGPKVEMIAKTFMHNPISITVGDKQGKTSENVNQRIEWCPNANVKKSKFVAALRDYDEGPIIVFANTRKSCDAIAEIVSAETDHSVCVIHASKDQKSREAALKGFRDGYYSVMVATDIVGRGIDVQNVKLVINYELPTGKDAIEKYTHRIGRTGRAGQKGDALSLVTDTDVDIMYDLKNKLTEDKVHIPQPMLNHPASKVSPRDPSFATLVGPAAKRQAGGGSFDDIVE